jgi:hypothetical protein
MRSNMDGEWFRQVATRSAGYLAAVGIATVSCRCGQRQRTLSVMRDKFVTGSIHAREL